MKSKDLPVSECTYAAFIIGHSETGKLSETERVLDSMEAEGIVPQSYTYTCLMRAYARHGRLDKIIEVRMQCSAGICED